MIWMFGHGETVDSQIAICLYVWLQHLLYTCICVKKCGESAQVCTSMQCQGDTQSGHTAAVRGYTYHAPQAQPCLPDEEICIGSMLAADLFVWGASKSVRFASNHSVAMHEYIFISRALGLSRFPLDFPLLWISPGQRDQCACNL